MTIAGPIVSCGSVNLIICFLLIVLLIRIKIPIGYSLLLVSIFLSLIEFGIGNKAVAPFILTLTDDMTWRFIATVVLIVTFGEVLALEGYMGRLVDTLRGYLSPNAVSKAAPALIGLLPMPGGAMVSAPLIQELGKNLDISAARKTVTNYWWRHIWEPIWPLYQSVILAAAILNTTVWRVGLMTFPITVSSILIGFVFMSPDFGSVKNTEIGFKSFLVRLGHCLWPIIAIFGLGLAFKGDLIIPLVIVYIVFIAFGFTSAGRIWRSFKNEFSFDIIALFTGSLALAKVISMGRSAGELSAYFQTTAIGPYLAVVTLPFLIGLLTGMTSAYVGVGFPMVISLFDSVGGQASGTILAYAGGLMGIMASPVHLCLVLTKKYFGADFEGIYRLLLPPIALVLIMVLAVDLIIGILR